MIEHSRPRLCSLHMKPTGREFINEAAAAIQLGNGTKIIGTITSIGRDCRESSGGIVRLHLLDDCLQTWYLTSADCCFFSELFRPNSNFK